MLIVGSAATASAVPPIGQKHNGFSKADERYLHTYVQCWHAFKGECGRNIVDDGLSSGRPASDRRISASRATMERWLNPPAPVVAAPTSIAPSTPTYTSVSTTSALPSCTWAPESGGSYTAYNPSSQAGGKYQFLPSTWASLGYSGAPQDAPPAEQEAAAQQLYAQSGTSPWVNC